MLGVSSAAVTCEFVFKQCVVLCWSVEEGLHLCVLFVLCALSLLVCMYYQGFR